MSRLRPARHAALKVQVEALELRDFCASCPRWRAELAAESHTYSFQMLSDWVADVCDGDGVEASWGGGEVEAFGSKSSVVIKVDLRCQACAQNIRGNSNFQHFEAGDTSFKIDFAEALSLQ